MSRPQNSGWHWLAKGLLLLATGLLGTGNPTAAGKPGEHDAERGQVVDLPSLMKEHKPPYVRPDGPPDKSITFERVDVVIERGFPGPAQAPYLSIGRDGSYLYRVNPLDLPGKKWPGARIVARLPPPRMAELQRLLEATEWLTAAGGEGRATHTDADRMTVAVTRDGKPRTIIFEGNRPAPYAVLQKFFYDLARQEQIFYRLTWLPEERRAALHELHDAIESELRRPGKQLPQQHFTFERYHELFAAALDNWYAKETEELCLAVDLMTLLKRGDHAATVARLRNDRDRNLRTAVARALPVLAEEQAVTQLAEMIESTEQARLELIGLGEPAVAAIAAIIDPDATTAGMRSVAMIRAYIDNWNKLANPIDARIVQAVKSNMQVEQVRVWGLMYHREFLKLADEPEPKAPTLSETARHYLKHLQAGTERELAKIVDNTATTKEWLTLRKSFAPTAELALEELYVDKTSALFVTKPFQDKDGNEIRLNVFMNLVRGIDWRVGPALSHPAAKTLYKDRFLQSHPDAEKIEP